jgi:hypothetical protein
VAKQYSGKLSMIIALIVAAHARPQLYYHPGRPHALQRQSIKRDRVLLLRFPEPGQTAMSGSSAIIDHSVV